MKSNKLRQTKPRVRALVVVIAIVSLIATAYFTWPSQVSQAATSELFFSEYIEGSGTNKALEIYNGTGAAINLATNSYNVQMFFNGSATAGLTINLTGTVADGDVFVLAQPTANAAILAQADQLNGAGWYNGNDAVVLRKGTTVIDVIGQIGNDPGTEWGSGVTSTADNTLRRKSTICAGDLNGTDSFNPATEWDGFLQNDSANLGAHTANCGATPTLTVSNVTQAETNAGLTTFTFNVNLSTAAGAGGVSFTINTADGTTNPANAGSDYVAIVNGSGSISAGGTSTTINVSVSGDMTPEANETFFVNLSNITGTTNSTAQGLGTITNDDITITRIYTIQGSGMSSLLTGNSVTTIGIVTGKRSLGVSNNGFYIQDPTGDGDTATSDGILVFTGSTVPTVNVGDFVQVSGTVTEFEPATTDEPDGIAPADPKTATELTGSTTTVISPSNPLPSPRDVTVDNILNPAATSRGAELEKYEFMRLSVSSLTVSQPTNDFGEFWGVETPRPRPFREPGIEAGDPIPAADEPPYAPGPPPFPPSWDGNFERIMVDSGAALTTGSTRRPQVQVTTGTLVTNIVGPLDYAFDAYRIVLDANVTPGVAGGVTAATAVPLRAAGEFTIGHANLENFGRSNGVLVFPGRLNKASLAVRNVLHTPDILGVIEVFDLASLQDLADKINSDVGNLALVNYVAYLDEGVVGGNDQDIGYLVNSARVTVVGTPQQHNPAATFTYCGVNDLLHDRPAYVLNAVMPRSGGGTVPVTVILNHTKSLIATDSPRPFGSCGTGTEGARNREKRRLQAEDIADLIETNNTGNLVVLGDLNAFDFNDGLGDIVGTMRGNPVPPENVVEPSVDRWSQQLTNLIYTVTADQQYSLLFEGNAQALDHVLVNGAMLAQNTDFAYGRYNADFSESYAADTNRPERLSDHDAPVAYFLFPADNDGDGVPDANDNCPSVANPDQANADGDALGDACDACPNDPNNDEDGDGVCGNVDNCPTVANPNQENADGDLLGDACDACPNDAANDADGDGVCGNDDNCPTVANPGQENTDGDLLGDACDACPLDPANDVDGDGVCGNVDNCPTVFNPDQTDTDNNGVGDACTAFQFPAGGAFVIGNNVSLAGGATVYFWGSQWAQNNPMSGGSASNSFKGFEGGNPAPTCGGTWTSSAGNSSNPPATVPQFMAVIVAGSIQKNGSVLSGNITKIVIVETNPGYGPSPGQAGTGKVVAVVCSSSSLSAGFRTENQLASASLGSIDWMHAPLRWTAQSLGN